MPLTARLLIEPLDHVHAAGLVAALDHPEVGLYTGGPAVTTVEAMHERIDELAAGPGPDLPEDNWWNWAVLRSSDRLVMGYIQATGYGSWAEVAYVFGPTTGGQGYATEAVQWLVGHLAERGMPESWAAVHHANASSIRLVERLGFQRVAEPTRQLGSYDDGDLVFRFDAAPDRSHHG
ncbi:MAG: GNAT family N-acetyltransferase [Ilumatobacteraceae bacterium]